MYRKDREDGYGGVVAAIMSDINHEVLEVDPRLEACFIKVLAPGNTNIILASVYRPPNRDATYLDLLCENIENIVQNHKNSIVWIGGDLNLPDISWTSYSIEGNQYPQGLSERFLNMLNPCNLEQTVQETTRNEKTLDMFLTNRPSLVNRCSTIPGLGNHEAVCIDTSVRANMGRPAKRSIPL